MLERSRWGIARRGVPSEVYKPQVRRSTTTVRRRPQNSAPALPGRPDRRGPGRSGTAEKLVSGAEPAAPSISGGLSEMASRIRFETGPLLSKRDERPGVLHRHGTLDWMVMASEKVGGRGWWGIGLLWCRIASADELQLDRPASQRNAPTRGMREEWLSLCMYENSSLTVSKEGFS